MVIFFQQDQRQVPLSHGKVFLLVWLLSKGAIFGEWGMGKELIFTLIRGSLQVQIVEL
jgi:hypothetical protein